MSKPKPKIPVIYYEETPPGEPVNPIPYIEVQKNEEMPKVLFISEYKETGEFEVDAEKGSVPIVDMLIHKYVDLDHLQKVLKPIEFDKIRVALGMKPLKQARKAGKPILDKIFQNAETRKNDLQNNEDERAKRAFSLGEKVRRNAEEFLKHEKENQQKQKEKESKS